MLDPAVLKLGRDLWLRRRQAALVILALAVSTGTLGLLLRVRFYLTHSLEASLTAAAPPQAVFQTSAERARPALRALPSVQAAESVRRAAVRVHFGTELWYALDLTARADLAGLQIDTLQLVAGRWPQPGEPGLVLERSARARTAAGVGDTLTVYSDAAGETQWQVTGLVYAPSATPAQFSDNQLTGFTTPEALTSLSDGSAAEWVYVRWAGAPDPAAQAAAAEQARQALELQGLSASYRLFTELPASPLTRYVDTAVWILTVIGALGAGLVTAWVAGVLREWLAQERGALGTLKALGFTRGRLLALYLGEALALGGLAWPVGVVASAAAAWPTAQAVAAQLNVDLRPAPVPGWIWAAEALVALALPALAMAYPAGRAARLTAREAFQRGAAPVDSGPLPAALTHRLPPPAAYALRNLLRQRARTGFAGLTLLLAGLVLLTVLSLNASLERTLAASAAYQQEDIYFQTRQPVGRALLRNELAAVPGVTRVEPWLAAFGVARQWPDGHTSSAGRLDVIGVPPETAFLQPTLLAGRWLRADDLNALVIDAEFLRREPDLQVGDALTLTAAGRALTWQVVGIVTGQVNGYAEVQPEVAYARDRYLSEVTGLGGLANLFFVETQTHDLAAQTQAARQIEDQLHAYRFSPERLGVGVTRRAAVAEAFALLQRVSVLLAVLFALVGGLSLVNVLQLNLLERAREIGVIRALGGDAGALLQLVAGETLALALPAGLLALALGWPVSQLICDSVGRLFLNAPLAYVYPAAGAAVILALTALLALAGALWALRQVLAQPLRETLAWE